MGNSGWIKSEICVCQEGNQKNVWKWKKNVRNVRERERRDERGRGEETILKVLKRKQTVNEFGVT